MRANMFTKYRIDSRFWKAMYVYYSEHNTYDIRTQEEKNVLLILLELEIMKIIENCKRRKVIDIARRWSVPYDNIHE